MGSEPYDRQFYTWLRRHEETGYSARVISRRVWELYEPSSVVDVGCGVGTWLAAFDELGADEIAGIEGPWLDREQLVVPRDRVSVVDLRSAPPPDQTFDLAVSLEVAEHLPPEHAEDFVTFLCELAPVVLFSAAIPEQGGTDHRNERWPDYWARLFERKGYRVLDWIRPHVWDDDGVAWWYAQNTLLYVRDDLVHEASPFSRAEALTRPGQIRLVHPRCFSDAIRRHTGLTNLLGKLPGALLEASRTFLSRIQR